MNAPNKGLHPLAWVAIGCGGLIVIGVIVMVAGGLFVAKKVSDVAQDFEANPAQAMAETVVRLNPDLDLVESNAETGKITIRDKKSGETMTFDFEDITEGKFSMESSDGETMTFDATSAKDGEGGGVKITTNEGELNIGGGDDSKLPDWLIHYPGASEPQSNLHMATPEGVTGMCTFTSTDPVDDVVKFYEDKLKAEGYEVQTMRIDSADSKQGVVTGESASPKRTQAVNVMREGDKTQIGITYNGK